MKQKSQAQIWLEYLLVRAWVLALQSLPREGARTLGRWMGDVAYVLDRRHRKVALSNLARALGESLAPEQAGRVVRRMFEHFGMVAAEFALAPRVFRPDSLEKYITVHNRALIEDARARSKGLIFVTGHLGNWEVLGMCAGDLGIPLHSVFRPLDNPLLDLYVMRLREHTSQRTVPRRRALPVLVRVLRRGGCVALVADQHARGDGIWVDFFARPASTTPAPAALALRTGASLILAFACRRGRRFHFDLYLERLPVEDTGDRQRDVERITAHMNAVIERYVRRFPDQWLWAHRRWHTPPGTRA